MRIETLIKRKKTLIEKFKTSSRRLKQELVNKISSINREINNKKMATFRRQGYIK